MVRNSFNSGRIFLIKLSRLLYNDLSIQKRRFYVYFWNIKRLKSSLIEAPLPENKAIKYLLYWIFIWSFVRISPLQQMKDPGKIILDIAFIPIVLIGTYYCFKKNGGPNGVLFLQRFLSIGLVIAARILLMIFAPCFLAMTIIGSLIGQIPITTTWYHIVLSLGVLTITLWRIGFHISQVAKNTTFQT